MIVLTDTTHLAESLLSQFCFSNVSGNKSITGLFPPVWQIIPDHEIPDNEKVIWSAFGCGNQMARCQVSTSGLLDFWDYLVVIDHAHQSQFDILKSLDHSLLPGPVACVAATGEGFHGHHDRSWVTNRGNLHLSTCCNPQLDASGCGLSMTTLPAVAVMDALSNKSPWSSDPGIKWVNDILIDDHKIAGVLTATQSFRNQLTGLTLGIGLNIENSPGFLPDRFVPRPGCLNDFSTTGHPITVGEMLEECLLALANRLSAVRICGPDDLVNSYRKWSMVIGRRVSIWPDQTVLTSSPEKALSPKPIIEGVVDDIGPDLALSIVDSGIVITRGRLALED